MNGSISQSVSQSVSKGLRKLLHAPVFVMSLVMAFFFFLLNYKLLLIQTISTPFFHLMETLPFSPKMAFLLTFWSAQWRQPQMFLHLIGKLCGWVRTHPSMERANSLARLGGMNARFGEMEALIWTLASELPTLHPCLTHFDLLALLGGLAGAFKNQTAHPNHTRDVLAFPPSALLPLGFPSLHVYLTLLFGVS